MNIFTRQSTAVLLVATTSVTGLTGTALAATSNQQAKLAVATTKAANDQTRLTNLQTRGAAEIQRRLVSLGKLNTVINGDAKLSASDKTYLANEVSTETIGLTALAAKLAADTDAASARVDVASLYSEYRVYALVMPKVHLVRAADDQQVAEAKLTALAAKLQTRITAAQTAGKDVTALEASLNELKAKVAAASTISTTMGAKVLTLQPADYNANHALLSGDAAQLKIAHSNNQAAYADAKTIVAGLKNLK